MIVECVYLTGGATQSPAQQDPVEKAVTLQLGTLLTALNELVQTALPPGSCTDALLRELSRTYAIFTILIKYVSAPLSSRDRTEIFNTHSIDQDLLCYKNTKTWVVMKC